MATSQLSKVVQYLRRGALLSDGGGLSDGQLLECYLEHREEAAFKALMRRHGAMVWGVCRRIIGSHHDAEDAFQATFLVLFRKAASVEPREMVGNWLYGVAYQTALKAKATAARRRTRERQVPAMPEPEIEQDLWRDLLPVLDKELSRLRDKYRVPVILCDLEGKTHKEAARRLGCPEGTLSSRLSRARTMLARRLARHGLALSAGSLAAVLAQNAASACVPAAVVSGTIRAVTLVAAGQGAAAAVSANAAVLAEGVVKTMLLTKLKCVTVVLAAVSGLAVGAGVLGHALATEQGNGTLPAKAKSAKVGPALDAAQGVPGRMTDAQRSDGSWNLRQIGIALRQYNEEMKSLPAHALYSKDGKTPLLSWRVAILPYIGQNALYQEFKLDEPWDSPHNKKLIAKMPPIYEPAGPDQREEGLTYWQVFTGADTVFNGKKKMAIADIKDGPANTILVIEGKKPVTWTKPADLTLLNDEEIKILAKAKKRANIETIMKNAGFEFAKWDIESRIQAARSDLEDWKDRAAWSARMAKKGLMSKPQADADASRRDAAQSALAKLEEEKRLLVEGNATDLTFELAQGKRSLLAQIAKAKADLENYVNVDFVEAKKDVESRIEAAKSELKFLQASAARFNELFAQGAMSKKQFDDAANRRDAAQIALAKVEEEKRVLVDFTFKRTVTDLTAKVAQAERIAKLAEMSEAQFAVGGLFKNGILVLFCDGAVRLLPRDTEPALLRAMITPNGGEVVEESKLKK
jgi:RNA polymerase sigma factor (sigma-70 family)